MDNIDLIQKNLEISFNDRGLLETALTHRSYLNEHKNIKYSNERLEFLGDAVLQFLSSQYLYQKFSASPEGELTNYRASLVCAPSLAEVSRQLNLGEYLFLSRGEEDSGGRKREYILANTFEALLGAIFLDQGLPTCQKILEKNLFPKIDEIVRSQTYKDYKSRFQELSQEQFDRTPEYKELAFRGPDHDRIFLMGAFVNGKEMGSGEGSSKQKAEQAAAKDALVKMGIL